jgi:hypothetical protein
VIAGMLTNESAARLNLTLNSNLFQVSGFHRERTTKIKPDEVPESATHRVTRPP